MPEKQGQEVPDESASMATDAPLTVTQAAVSGTERQLLVAMRSQLAKRVEDATTPAPALAAISRQLLMVDKDIRAIDAREQQEREAESGEAAQDEPFDPEAI